MPPGATEELGASPCVLTDNLAPERLNRYTSVTGMCGTAAKGAGAGAEASRCDKDTGLPRLLPPPGKETHLDKWVAGMKITDGNVYGMLPDGRALVATMLPDDTDTAVRVFWSDKQKITPNQRKKIFAIVSEIACWSGYSPEDARKGLMADFLRKNIETLQMSAISLAVGGNCDKGTASLYIDYLINFCLENGVPTARPLQEYADDLSKYTYAALMHKKCLICGQKADVHHCEGSMVGMGRNRKTMIHVGLELMPLCRKHHDECHKIGQKVFDEKYHVIGIVADERICKRLGLKYAE